ncbi:hypothetical protein HNP46_001953 [Pseudomonas nitritireducens]|uniref:Uncharacterized protein n=1 Tax=Pseudomonas nitroreducens TaxID=46680 RepID=A0A7W7NZU6_PSENT|nr:hypothetical protein [Pseudomonas nitritireducens]MBB4863108.1 hypothetical protein [Pseudomonas nitritireducens]
MLRTLLGWMFCLLAVLLGAPLLSLLAEPRSLEPAADIVLVSQLFSALIGSAGLFTLLIAFLLRLNGRTIAALALPVPALALCAWHLTHAPLALVSPTPEQYRYLLVILALYGLVLAAIAWVGRRDNAGRKLLRYLGYILLLPWGMGLFYLARLY